MNSRTTRTKAKPQMLIKETLYKTKSFFPRACEPDNFYRSLSGNWNSIEVVSKQKGQLSPELQMKGGKQCSRCSMSVADCSASEDLKEDKASKCSGRKQEKSSFLAPDVLAEKMKELEMMDVKNVDHLLDIEEVLHYYSRLTCPAYIEIVDKFFMDMYTEFNVPQRTRSVNSSMRKSDSASVHSSMRSLGPLKL